jgi:hypothetical protein
MTTENKTSLTLTLALIGFALLIAAISKAGSPATNQPPVLFCGLLRDCVIG